MGMEGINLIRGNLISVKVCQYLEVFKFILWIKDLGLKFCLCGWEMFN